MVTGYRMGIDIGGTFTDLALHNMATGELVVWKELSTPRNPALGALSGARAVLQSAGARLEEVNQILHGTTIGVNIIVERKGARTALITTQGFGDILEIQRQLRHSPYDLHFARHEPLVPRDLVFEVPERTRFDGSVDRALDEDAVMRICQRLRELEIEAVAVSLLHSYVNPLHEQRIAEILADRVPGILVSLSSDIAPQLREYERTSTTVANAYVRPAFKRYLDGMESSLRREGFTGMLYLMQGNGGLSSPSAAAAVPVRVLESGPAAGVTMTIHYVEACGSENLLAFEMGGTTAKACFIEQGRAKIIDLLEVDQALMRPTTGLPILTPAIDLVEIGAGGGSVARTGFGVVQVGPQSAGAEPGPASYGLGGAQATVTDANVVLGYLNPFFFNEGRMHLRPAKAAEAVERDIGTPLGLPLIEAAWGIYEAATANMENAIRAVSIERGHDPRELVLVAGGGAGPLHASRLARSLSIPRIFFPRVAGVLSAVGLLTADPRFDLIQTLVVPLDSDLERLEGAFAQLVERAAALLDRTGLPGPRVFTRAVDMRYRGQGYLIEVQLGSDECTTSASDLKEAFERQYADLYGYSDSEFVPEIASVRVSATIQAPRVSPRRGSLQDDTLALPEATRDAYFPEMGGMFPCPVFKRADLPVGAAIVGPAIIEDGGSTVVLVPGDRARVDRELNLLVDARVDRDNQSLRTTLRNLVGPLTLGTIWRSLLSAANDAGAVLQRTAYSEAIREGRDFSIALFDRRARLIAQGDFSPGHLGSMPDVVRHVLDVYPEEDLRPGDAILLNDPWLGSGHLPDFLLTVPVFHQQTRRIVGFAVSCVHMIDVGGAAPGSQAVVGIMDVFQEGLRFLPTRIWRRDGPTHEVLRLIEANVRVPDKLLGDLRAMRNAGRVAEERLLGLVNRYGVETFDSACDEIITQSSEAMRASILEIPDCVLHAIDYLDDCGPGTDPLRIEVTATIEGDELTIDFEGSSPQTRSGINAVANYTRAYSYFVAKVVTHGATLPQNAGSIEPICWKATEGSVVHAQPPAGVGARAIMQQRIVDVLMQALAPALPERVLAPSSHWANPIIGGTDPRTGRQFVFYEIIVGGFGGRDGRDGIEAMCASFNIDGIPVEVNEHSYPVLVERYELIRDSAGAGRWRGGHGVRKDLRLLGEHMQLSNLAERHRFAPPGLLGGHPGSLGSTTLNPNTERQVTLHAKGSYRLTHGDTISNVLSGGGGFGDPIERDSHAVARDVRQGWLSRQRAATVYGVVLDEKGAVDVNATDELREAKRGR